MFRLICVTIQYVLWLEGRHEDVSTAGQWYRDYRQLQERSVPPQRTIQPDAASNRSHPPPFSGRLVAE